MVFEQNRGSEYSSPSKTPHNNKLPEGGVRHQDDNIHNKPKPLQTPEFMRSDWNEFRASLYADYDILKANMPDISKEIIIVLKSGSTHRGYIKTLDDTSVSIETSQQNHTMTIARNMCTENTQNRLWPLPQRDIYVRQKLGAEFETIKHKISQHYDQQINQLNDQIECTSKEVTGEQYALAGTILQVLNTDSILLYLDKSGQIVRIDGVRSGFVDGDRVSFQAYYVGTFEYITALGAQSTVRRYSTHTPSRLLKKLQSVAQLKRKLNQLQKDKDTSLDLCEEKEREVLIATPISEFKATSVASGGIDASTDRYEVLYDFCATKFHPPMRKTISITLKSGRLLKGEITDIDEESVSLNVGGSTLSFPKESLSEASRIVCFRHDYAHYWATKKLNEERARK